MAARRHIDETPAPSEAEAGAPEDPAPGSPRCSQSVDVEAATVATERKEEGGSTQLPEDASEDGLEDDWSDVSSTSDMEHVEVWPQNSWSREPTPEDADLQRIAFIKEQLRKRPLLPPQPNNPW